MIVPVPSPRPNIWSYYSSIRRDNQEWFEDFPTWNRICPICDGYGATGSYPQHNPCSFCDEQGRLDLTGWYRAWLMLYDDHLIELNHYKEEVAHSIIEGTYDSTAQSYHDIQRQIEEQENKIARMKAERDAFLFRSYRTR